MTIAGIRLAQETIENLKKAEDTIFNRSLLRYWKKVLKIEKAKA